MRQLEICIDFDGTCVTHEYPNIGKDIGAQHVLRRLVSSGHKLIIYTMRSGDELEDAKRWFNKNDIPIYGVNTNPTQTEWTTSPKAYANLYIDDAALGAPITISDLSNRPYIDWGAVENILEMDGVIPVTNDLIKAIREDMIANKQKSNLE